MPAYIKSKLTNSFGCRPFAMTPISIRTTTDEVPPTPSPRSENQLAHMDWAGRELSNLPEECRRRRPAIEEDSKI